MSYTSGLLKDRVEILNRTEAKRGQVGFDSAGIEWQSVGTVWANVGWQKGYAGMRAGSLDVYGVVMVRMRWNTLITERSRIRHNGKTYQILGDTFHPDRQENTIQFHTQAITNE